MTNKERIQEHNQKIQNCIELAENLPTVNENDYEEGYQKGYEEGLAKRTYETWTLTLADGSVIEKEVALL